MECMTTADTVAPRKHAAVTTGMFVLLFWVVAALLVIAAHQMLGALPAEMCVAAKVVAIIAAAGAYMKIVARHATLDHALAVGVVWLVLAIAAEVLTSERSGHAWFDLIGSPDSALRNILLIAWVIAPALFAQYGE